MQHWTIDDPIAQTTAQTDKNDTFLIIIGFHSLNARVYTGACGICSFVSFLAIGPGYLRFDASVKRPRKQATEMSMAIFNWHEDMRLYVYPTYVFLFEWEEFLAWLRSNNNNYIDKTRKNTQLFVIPIFITKAEWRWFHFNECSISDRTHCDDVCADL